MAKEHSVGRGGSADWASRLSALKAEQWRRLLNLAKRRRGARADRLVYVGLHNVADVWWCAERAVRKARERELSFFAAHVRDRVRYSVQLGRAVRPPRRLEGWLDIGEDLSADDLERILATRRAKAHPVRPVVAQAKGDVLYVDPALPEDKRQYCATWAQMMGWELADADDDPALWAEMLKERRVERYPAVRWSFDWENYVLIAWPEGVTDRFVYEFRLARADHVARRFVKPVATAQGDLCAWLFDRPLKRVQIFVSGKEKTYTIEAPPDRERAAETLAIFQRTDAGQPPRPPAEWKCHPARCEYFEPCKVRLSATKA